MIYNLSKPFRWFFKLEAASGLVLLFAAIIALIISNSNLANLYFSTLNQYLFIGINDVGIKLSVIHWINDALMAIFFFFVTLEIKREFLQGELSNIKQALLPIIGAVGGMLVPALFYVYINFGDSETLNAFKVALSILWGLDVPVDFATTSFMPKDSNNALIGPPAIIPVPGAADLRITFPAPNRPTTSWCNVLFSLR